MAGTVNRQIILAELPKGKLRAGDFQMREASIPKARDGEVLLRVRLVSLDAANRAWIQGETYRAATKAGSVMDAFGLAEVVESKAAGFRTGRPRLHDDRLAGLPRPASRQFGQS
jgi:NADPH-dependent curcumin reductase CurA